MTRAYDEAMEADRDLSLQVLGALPEEPAYPEREERVNAVNALAAVVLSLKICLKLENFNHSLG